MMNSYSNKITLATEAEQIKPHTTNSHFAVPASISSAPPFAVGTEVSRVESAGRAGKVQYWNQSVLET